MNLHPVPPEHVDATFTILSREVESIAARSSGRFTVEDLRDALKTMKMLAWVAVFDTRLHAIVLAEIAEYPQRKVCRLVGCAGRDRKKWLPLLSEIETWAASIGCTMMQAHARKGWLGDLPTYRMTHCILEKELAHG